MESQQPMSAVEQKMLAGLKFCERCKASIPESQFHDGHALHMGNRNVHVECLLKRSHMLPAIALAVGAVGLILGALGLARAGGGKEDGAPSTSALSADVEKAVERARAAEARATAVESQVAALASAQKSELSRLAADATAQAAAARDALGKEKAELLAAVSAQEQRVAKAEGALGELSSISGRLGSLSEALTDLRKEIAALKARGDAAAKPPQ
jgi:hypothetical protein